MYYKFVHQVGHWLRLRFKVLIVYLLGFSVQVS